MRDPSNSDRPDGPPNAGTAIDLAPRVRVPAGALRVQFARSGGPGGQNVNKLNTKAEIWLPLEAIADQLTERAMTRLIKLAGRKITRQDELHISCETTRSQERNRQEALLRLRELLIAAMHEPKTRRKTRPSRASRERRLHGKKRRSAIIARRKDHD